MTDVLALLRQHEPDLKRRFGVTMIGIFGPFIHGEEPEGRGVDVLVSFRSGKESFDNLMDCKGYLEHLFGHHVDLILNGIVRNRFTPYIPGETLFAWNHAPYLDNIPVPVSIRKAGDAGN